jgi:hypothetical protein
MNPYIPAEQLEHQIEKLASGTSAELSDSSPLLAIASELRFLPDPDFKSLLMAGLMEETAPLESSFVHSDANPSRVAALSARGLLARAMQHEIEHLDGRVFLQHLSPLKRELMKRQIKKRIKAGDWIATFERPQAP